MYCGVVGCRPCSTISASAHRAPPWADGEEEMWAGRFFSAEHPWHVECQDERGTWWNLEETTGESQYRFASQVDADLAAAACLREVTRWSDSVAVRVRNVDVDRVGCVLHIRREVAS